MLPDSITNMWDPSRDFAHAKLPLTKAGPNICSIHLLNGVHYLYVVIASGDVYFYTVPTQGGECTLVKSDTLIDHEED